MIYRRSTLRNEKIGVVDSTTYLNLTFFEGWMEGVPPLLSSPSFISHRTQPAPTTDR